MQAHVINDCISYSIEPDLTLFRSRWLAAVDGEGYRESMLHLCGRIGQEHVKHWLHHASTYYFPTLSDQAWMVEVLYPLLARTDLRRVAVVVSEDLFLQTVLEQLCNRSKPIFKGGIRMRTFYDAKSAEEWLLAGG